MTKTVLLMCAALSVVAAPGIGRATPATGVQNDELAAVRRISQADFKQALAGDDLLVLDVRDAASYASGHIPGAISIPLDELAKHVAELKAERRPIVTYCA